MRLPAPLIQGILERRYKRFLADIHLDDGSLVTAHCPNPGSMLGLADPGRSVWLSRSADPRRKLPFSLELVEVDIGSGPALVGINTSHPNRLVAEALETGAIAELAGYDRVRREVRYGHRSRVDFVLQGDGRPDCYVEVKNVHLMRRPGLAEFPDSVTARGARHLDELSHVARSGQRAVMLFVVQRADAAGVALAGDLDPAYQDAFARAAEAGVETLAYRCDVGRTEIVVAGALPFTPP